MRVALFYLLGVFALLGSIDVIYFHIVKLKLSQRRTSRLEQVTHLIRALLFVIALCWVMYLDAYGIYALGLPVILLVDFANSLFDVVVEPESRKSLGGLPPMEYVVHMLTMFISGAIITVAILDALSRWSLPPHMLVQRLDVPVVAFMAGWQMIIVTLILCGIETFGLARSLLVKAKP